MLFFPTLNAFLNSLSFVFLFLGWRAIKAGKRDVHKKFMLAALAASFLFLCSYLTYHFLCHGFTRYQGEGILRPIYFLILLTHTPLAVLIVPFCVAAVYFALKGDFKKHTAITRWLFPAWMYVSLTGVLIYFMLYIF